MTRNRIRSKIRKRRMRMSMRMREHTKDTRHVDHNAKKKAEEEEDDNACLRCCLEPWLTVPDCAGAAVSQ